MSFNYLRFHAAAVAVNFLSTPILADASLGSVSQANCPTYTHVLNGSSVSPAFKEGDTLLSIALPCVEPATGQYALLETPANRTGRWIVKKIAATPGDIFKLVPASDTAAPTTFFLEINGQYATNPQGDPYRLAAHLSKRLKLYQGVLSGYLFLGNEGSLDASRFGITAKKHIKAVVIGVADPQKSPE